MRTPRINDSVGSALRSVGSQLSALGEHYARQQEATEALQARQGFLELQNTLQQDYRTTMEQAPETGAGVYDSWFSQDETNPGLFNRRAEEFIASLPESQQDEYRMRLTQLGGEYDDTVARDELRLRQAFAGNVIEQQVEASAVAIGQNPELLDAHVGEVASLISQSGLSRSQAMPIMRAAEQQLALAAAQAGVQQDPEAWEGRIERHLQSLASGQGGSNEQQLVGAALQVEAEFGIPAQDLLSIMSFETAGTLDPWQRGPTTQWGQHRGLIQWGEPQRRQYGVSQTSTIQEQVAAAARYLMDRGYQPGMRLENMYAAVLAGDANRTGVGDLHNGGVARSAAHAVQNQFGGHIARAQSLLAQYGQGGGDGDQGQRDPVLARIQPSQLQALQADARDAVTEARRVSEYDATVFEQTVQDNLASIRETGRPIEGLNDEDVLRALGEEEFAVYERERQGAMLYHRATDGMESLPTGEIEARVDSVRAEPGTPGFELAETVRSEVQEYADTLRAERLEDPASAVRRIPEMREAEENLDLADAASVSAFITENLRWQSVLGIPFESRAPIPRAWARTLADDILELQFNAQRSNRRPADAMQSSINSIRAVFGDQHSEAVTMMALSQMTGSDDLANIAMSLFRQVRRGDRVAPATTTQAEDAIDMTTINQGLEPLDMGVMP
jgi:hypothetical protein